MDSVVVKETLIEQISNLSSLHTIIETIMVDDTLGNIDLVKTQKIDGKIVNKTEKIFYKLKSTRLLIKSDKEFKNNIVISDIDDQVITNNQPLCECIARNTNIIISKEFNRLKNVDLHKVKFWKRNLFEKLFPSRLENKFEKTIIDLSQGFDWIIIPNSIQSFFEKNKNFEKNVAECENLLHLFGKFHNINVFLNPDQKESKIYFGNFNSLTLVINKNLELKDTKSFNSTFINSTSMKVQYSFIENQQIRVIEVY